jgi:hypothetical protein
VTDFVGLSRAARELPGPDTHDRLWAAWCALPVWHFVKAMSPSGMLPASMVIHGQRCVLGFTTAGGAQNHARQTHHPEPMAPVMSLVPDVAVQLVPQLQRYGAFGLVVDPGPDGFYAPLDSLPAMLARYRRAPVGMAPPPPMMPPVAVPPPPAAWTIERVLALPAWHVVTTHDDPSFPELATRGIDLVAQVYTSEQAIARLAGPQRPSTAVMPPPRVIAMLAEIELVRLVRFDDHLEVDLVDLGTFVR